MTTLNVHKSVSKVNPLLALSIRLDNPQAAFGYIECNESLLLETVDKDTLDDILWAICGEVQAAWRAAKSISPAAAFWFDGLDGDSYVVRYWNGAVRGECRRSAHRHSEAQAILSAGILAYYEALKWDTCDTHMR